MIFLKKKKTLITAENVAIKLSIKNLLSKNKHLFKKIEINNFEINFNLKNLKKYNNIFKQKINFIPIVFKKGQIILLDRKNYVATINNANFNLKLFQDFNEIILMPVDKNVTDLLQTWFNPASLVGVQLLNAYSNQFDKIIH